MSLHFFKAALAHWSSPGSAEQSLQIQMPGSSFLLDTRAVRDGAIGGTLQGFIAIPSGSVGNHYFWFTQADSGGTQRGFDPAAFDASLAGYTGHQVSLANGVLDRDEVATALQPVMAAVYGSAVQSPGGIVTVTGEIDAASAFTGNGWSTRGQAGAWGSILEQGFTNSFAQNNTIFCHATAPAVDGTRVRAMQIRISTAYGEQLRLGLYEGGTSNNPTGAVLIYDFGQLPAGLPTNAWATLWVNGDVQVGNGTNLWIGVKGGLAGTTNINYQALATGNIGNFTSQPLYNADGAMGNDPSVAFPAPFPAGGVLTGFNFALAMRMVYESEPIVANGDWRRRFGVHVDASTMTATTMFNANILVGGVVPTQVEHMRLDYLEIAAQTDPTFRLGFAQGGVIEDPDGALLEWDGGRGPAGVPTAWYRVTAPTGGSEIPVDRTQVVWWWARGDGGQGPIRFSFGLNPPNPNQAGPNINPMDWPVNSGVGNRPEYEMPAANPNHSTNPDVPFESPVVTSGVDFYPGNIPGSAIGLAVDGFELTVL